MNGMLNDIDSVGQMDYLDTLNFRRNKILAPESIKSKKWSKKLGAEEQQSGVWARDLSFEDLVKKAKVVKDD